MPSYLRVLGVHPGPLMYTKVFLRLEPLGLELVAAAALRAGYDVRLIDLQVESHRAYHRLIARWRPGVIAFSCNYLANVPEIVDLAKATKQRHPGIMIVAGGHSASFIAEPLLAHGDGAIDCVLRGEGEAVLPALLAALEGGRSMATVAGAVTPAGNGPPPVFAEDFDALTPRGTCCVTGDAILSACLILPPQSSFPAVARGTARFAVPGLSTTVAIG